MEENKKSIKRILLNTLIIIVIVFIGIFLYAKYVGTKKITVKDYVVENKLIPESFNLDKVVYFTDLLYGSTFYLKDVETLVERINEYKPDIIIFGGDLISSGYKIKEDEKKSLIDTLNKLDASLGKYASLSKNDKDISKEILTSSNFIIEENKDYLVYDKSNNPICISILGSLNNNNYKIEETLNNLDKFTIVLTHESDLITEILKTKNPQMVLSGNTIGGEVNIPLIGGITKFKGSKKYNKEYYKIKETSMYVSSGLGTKKMHLRLFNRPSFTVFRLKNKN